MSENFLLKKDIKDIRISFFERGFAIPVDKQEKLSAHLSCGRLAHGEKRTIKFILDGKYFDATLRSVGFNRKKFPNHSEMWQINWKIDDAISKKVTEIFSKSYLDCSEDGEYFVIYSTATQDIFYFEPIFNREIFSRLKTALQIIFEVWRLHKLHLRIKTGQSLPHKTMPRRRLR